jgi:hypothetical protein
MSGLVISQDYGLVLLSVVVLALQLILTTRYVASARARAFTAEYYRRPGVKALVEEHKKATGEDKLPRSGYPDMGQGRFSDELPYDAWLALNNAQRAHYNAIEGFAPFIAFILIGGLVYPRFCAASAAVYAFGREVFSVMYTRSGANKRFAGALFFDLALVAAFGAAVGASWSLAGLPSVAALLAGDATLPKPTLSW